MDLYKLKYFHTAAHTKNFSEAAKKCFISQSAMSQSINQLESSLGTKLFSRSGKNIFLTESGEILLKHTLHIFDSVEKAGEEIKSLKKEMKGRVVFGTQANIGIYLLLKSLKAWVKKYSEVNVSMKYGSQQECLHLLKEGVIEFALVSNPPRNTLYQEVIFAKDWWTVVCSSHHPLAKKRKVRPQDLSQYKLMVPSKNNPRQKDFFERKFEKTGAYPEILLEANDAEALKYMVIHNFGFAILPERMIQKELKNGLVKDLNIPEFKVEHSIVFVYLKNKNLPFLAQKFIEFLLMNKWTS